MNEIIVYRLGGGVEVTLLNGQYRVKKNGHITGFYKSLEDALECQRY